MTGKLSRYCWEILENVITTRGGVEVLAHDCLIHKDEHACELHLSEMKDWEGLRRMFREECVE